MHKRISKNAVGLKQPRKIIWAVEPFSESAKRMCQNATAIEFVYGKAGNFIQPVSILMPDQYDPKRVSFLENKKDLEAAARQNLDIVFEQIEIQTVKPPHFLAIEGHSIRSAVKKLLDFAKKNAADAIAVSTHAREGSTRFLLGSFAETLVLQSNIPVLISNPKFSLKNQVRHILFPMDFSSKSRIAFERFVKLAEEINAKILLFHKMEYIYPELGYPFMIPAASSQSIRLMENQAKQLGKTWAEWSEDQGVSCTFHLSTSRESVSEGILRAANKLKSSGMIAMTSQTGPIASTLLGSVTRQIIRNASCPVLVIHPDEKLRLSKKNQRQRFELKRSTAPVLS